MIGEAQRGDGALGRGARPAAAAARGSSAASRCTRSTEPPDGGRHGPARARRPADFERLAAGVRGRARARARRSTRSSATPTASAGGRSRRSTRAARGSGSRTASSASRPRRPRGRRAPCSSQQVWVDPEARGRGVRVARAARPVPAAARDDADRDAVRAERERAGDRALRAIGMRRVLEYRSVLFVLEPAAVWICVDCSEPREISRGRLRADSWSCSSGSRRTSAAHELIEPGGEVLCLVSGGADSTCLFHALARARLPRLGAARRPRPARRGVRRGRARGAARAVRRRGRAGARRAARPRPSCATSATRSTPTACARPATRSPTRSRRSSTASRRAGRRRGSRCAARTASCGRSSACGARRPRRSAASAGSTGGRTRRTPTRCAA